MKFFSSLFLILYALHSYSQIDITHKQAQENLGFLNITAYNVGDYYSEIKQLSETETITLTYNLLNFVKVIEINSNGVISNERYHTLAKQLNPEFKITSLQIEDNRIFYYDSQRQLLNIKTYKTDKNIDIEKLHFISDVKLISGLIPKINSWK